MAICLLMLLPSCSLFKKDIIGNPDLEDYCGDGILYPKDLKDPYTVYIATSFQTDPDRSEEEQLFFMVSLDKSRLPDTDSPKDCPLQLYLFGKSEEYSWKKSSAKLGAKGKYIMDGAYPASDDSSDPTEVRLYEFALNYKKNLSSGEYTAVFLRSDNTVDCMYDIRISTDNHGFVHDHETTVAKPVIYLYPEETMDVSIHLDFEGDLTCTYPAYNDGWNVTAFPDGRILDRSTSRFYDYLFWEGRASEVPSSFEKAACIASEDSVAFLEEYLSAAGLNDSEIDDFISYWLPQLQQSPYNLISFPTERYEELARLDVFPKPDTEIRIYMVFMPLQEPVEIEKDHKLELPKTPSREGFTLVEWGGSKLSK